MEFNKNVDGFMQERRNTIANTMELSLFLHQPIDIVLIWHMYPHSLHTVTINVYLCCLIQSGHYNTAGYNKMEWYDMADPILEPTQWDMLLQSNAVSHWLGANLESALI